MSDEDEKPRKKKRKKSKGEASSDDAPKKKAKSKRGDSGPKFLICERTEISVESDDGEQAEEREVLVPLDHPDDFQSAADCKRWIRENAETLAKKRIMILHVKGRIAVEAQVTAIMRVE